MSQVSPVLFIHINREVLFQVKFLYLLYIDRLTAEAFEFQRISRDKNNVHDLLSHLFLGCQQSELDFKQ